MKALFLVALALSVSTVSASYGEEATAALAIARSHAFSKLGESLSVFRRPDFGLSEKHFSTADTDPSCTLCSDEGFLVLAIGALQTCTASNADLASSLSSAQGKGDVDNAWATFCASDCFDSMSQIKPKFYCCLGDNGPAFFNAGVACGKSKQSNRVCGAEYSNVGALGCSGSSSTCSASGVSCAFDADSGRCLFVPTDAVLSGVCTDCIAQYVNNFPTGGLNSPQTYGSIAGVYNMACSRFDDKFCFTMFAKHGYTFPSATSDLTGVCAANSPAAPRACTRQLLTWSAEATRMGGEFSYTVCASGSSNDAMCAGKVNSAIGLASALDDVAAVACANGGKCISSFAAAFGSQSDCLVALSSKQCSSACATSLAAAAKSAGCCGPTVGSTRALAVAGSGFAPRLIVMGGLQGVGLPLNESAGKGPDSTRAPQSGKAVAHLIATMDAPAPLPAIATCANIDGWTKDMDKCAASFTRAVTIGLNLRLAALTAAPTYNHILHKITVDIAVALGVGRRQITSLKLVANKTGSISYFGKDYPSAVAEVAVKMDSAADISLVDKTFMAKIIGQTFVMPFTGSYLAYQCPECLGSGYAPIVDGAAFAELAGSAPAPAGFNGNTDNNGAVHHSAAYAAAVVLVSFAALLI